MKKIKLIEERDLYLIECPKYNIKIVDTSFYDERDNKISEFISNITK